MKKKTNSYCLILLMLFQSCAIYQTKSVSLEEAYNRGKVKVSNVSGEDIVYRNIELVDGKYYGVKGKNKTSIDSIDVSFIYLKDINKSRNQATILVVLIVPVVSIILITKAVNGSFSD